MTYRPNPEFKFYTIFQNNSGGWLQVSNEIGKYMIIEATSEDDAWERLTQLPITYGSCECCGSRWDPPWEDDVTNYPQIYSQPATQHPGRSYMCGDYQTVRIIWRDGTITAFNRAEPIKQVDAVNEYFANTAEVDPTTVCQLMKAI